jgi:hypothetical protein
LLSSRSQQQHDSRSDDRQQTTRARDEAEALFRPKRQVIDPPVPEVAPPVDAAVRKPRVLPTVAPPVPATHAEPAVPVCVNQQVTHEIPPSQFARIRAWVAYGMTVPQVAEVCGVGVDEVERALRKA